MSGSRDVTTPDLEEIPQVKASRPDMAERSIQKVTSYPTPGLTDGNPLTVGLDTLSREGEEGGGLISASAVSHHGGSAVRLRQN